MKRRLQPLIELEPRLAPAGLPLADTSDAASNWILKDDRIAIRLAEGASRESLAGHSILRWLDDRSAIVESTSPLIRDAAWTAPVLASRVSGAETVALDEVIVALKEGISADEFFQDSRFASVRPLWGTTDQFVVALRDAKGIAAIDMAGTLESDPRVQWSEANLYQDWQRHFDPNDPEFLSGNMWHHRNVGQNGGLADADVDTDLAWDINPGGSTSRLISVIDDGLETTHPDLNPWVNPGETAGDGIDNDGNGYIDDLHGWNFVSNNNATITTNNDRHGTAVAGVAAAKGNNGIGVAGPSYNARVMIARIFENGSAANLGNIASAIYYAAGRNKSGVGTFATVHVQNNSWGGADYSNALTAAFTWAATTARGGLGTVVTISSGNDYAGRLAYPGQLARNIPGVIAVGATNNKGERSDYSNFGPGLTLVAPSSDLRSNYLGVNTTDRVGGPGYNGTDFTGTGPGSFGGTSASAPLVAGIAGLVLSQAEAKGINLSATQIRALLANGTDLIGGTYDTATGNSYEFGRGRINAFTSVDGVGKPEISIVSSTAELADGQSLPLGNAFVGASIARTYRIRNAGTSDLVIAGIAAASAKSSFSIEGFTAGTIKLGEAAAFTVRFAPTVTGADSGTVTITSNDASEGTVIFNVSGTGFAANASGRAFEDWNGNAIRDDNDPALARTVYLDANNNGTLDRATFSNPSPVAIPDNNANGISSSIAVSGVIVPVRNLTVTVNITHQYIGDLVLFLASPSGAAIQLASTVGGAGTSFVNTTFDDNATVPIDRGASPFTGSFRVPFDALAKFDGENANGNWILYVRDNGPFDVGTLQSWSLSLDAEAAATTDPQGRYAFGSLVHGNYTLRSVLPPDWTATAGAAGHTFTISAAESFADRNFGSGKNNRAYLRVRHDQNGDGILDPAEPGLSGRTVYSDANGNTAFNPPGGPFTLNKSATVTIPDNNIAGTSSTFNVSGLTGTISDLDITINALHPTVGDLEFKLSSPAGTSVSLINRRGGNGFTFVNTTLDDSAAVPIGNIINVQSPFTNSYRPESPLAAFNGENPNGIWILRVYDLGAGDSGTLGNWSLRITTSGELANTSMANGNAFLDLPAGPATLRLAPLAGWKTTTPAGAAYNLNAGGMPLFESTFGTAESIPPTVVLPIVVNGGAIQRSVVNSVTIAFSELVAFTGPAANAFTITGPGGAVPFTANIVGTTFTTATLNFATLPDGNYTLAVNAALINDPAMNPLTPIAAQNFHALLGDFNGSANVDAVDFAVFGNAFGSSLVQSNYFPPADFNSDTTIDAGDLALFGNRIGTTI